MYFTFRLIFFCEVIYLYYKIENGTLSEISISNIKNHGINIAILNLEELSKNYNQLGFKEEDLKLCNLSEKTRAKYEVYEDFSFATLNIINDQSKKINRLAFYIRRNIFIIVVLDNGLENISIIINDAIKKANNKITLEKFISYILNRIIDGSVGLLEKYEDSMIKIEDMIIKGKTSKNTNKDIFKLKKSLSLYFKYYKSIIRFVDMLMENDNDILDEENFKYLSIFESRIDRLVADVEYLIDETTHIQDLYRATLDYSQNNIMRVFTVVTTLFLPLTLITGWYGMNFKYMPELSWKYGYLGVFVISILIVISCIMFFKRKKLL